MSWLSLQWPRRPQAGLVSPALSTNLQVLELQTAKEILAEIFRARPEDIEDMIKRRLVERTWREEHEWPATFSLGVDMGRILVSARPVAKGGQGSDVRASGYGKRLAEMVEWDRGKYRSHRVKGNRLETKCSIQDKKQKYAAIMVSPGSVPKLL
jgi:hypothetical protein